MSEGLGVRLEKAENGISSNHFLKNVNAFVVCLLPNGGTLYSPPVQEKYS